MLLNSIDMHPLAFYFVEQTILEFLLLYKETNSKETRMSWYRKDNPDVVPGNPERIGKWDPIQYLDITKYLKPFNEYPKDFNPRVHGAYLPYMYYGKAETPFSQLKIKEIPGWFTRRNKTPMDAYQLGLRTFWRWYRAYGDCKKPNLIWVIQPFILFSLINFFTTAIPERKHHKWAKYH